MAERLDMSLDDIIKNNKKSDTNTIFRGGGRTRGLGHGRGRGRDRDPEPAPGPTRRSDNRAPTRTKPYFVPQAFHVQNMLVGGAGESNSEAGTRLYISNLDYEVSNEDIKVLFSDVGELKRYAIHYDKGGRSKGTAEVVYMRQSDAIAAMKRYCNMQLDGKPMRIELVGVNILTPVPVPPMQKGIMAMGTNSRNPSRSIQGRIVVGRGQARDGNNRGSEMGRGGGRPRPEKVSANDLDADLERYRLQAMHIE